MAVRIPSDLIVDVMKAVAPAQAKMAAARLQATSKMEASGGLFTEALQSLRSKRPSGDLVVGVMRAAEPAGAGTAARKLASLSPAPNDAYAQFESFMLRDAIEEMLPNSDSGAFGGGFAGGVWRSMAAEQFASIFTQHGGLGIAEMMRSRAAAPQLAAPDGQWPYYRGPAIAAYTPPVS